MSPPVGVVGGGLFGRGLAAAIVRGGAEAIVWSRRGRDGLPEGARSSTEASDLAACELIFVAVPSVYVPEVAPIVGAELDGRHYLVHVSRGLIGEELDTVSAHLLKTTPVRRVGCLAGPLNPTVLADAVPGGGIVGTGFPEVADAVRGAIGGGSLRLYDTDDIVGVELASALGGLLALAIGFAREANISPAALAVLLDRGLNEAAKVGAKLGARPETFRGMAGAGDLFAALAGDERAEVRLGRAMAKSQDLSQAAAAGAHIEGLSIASAVRAYAERVGVDAPIATVMAKVFAGELPPKEAMEHLMRR